MTGVQTCALPISRRLRRRGTTHPRPSSNARDIDLVLRATDNLTASQWAAVTLRTLAATIATRTASAHNIACVTIGDDGLDVLWDDPDPDVVTDWCTVDGGWTWHRPRAATVSTVRAPIPPCPTLVTVGRLNDSDVMINLETAGTVHLLGDATATADLARSFVVELASSPFTDAATVLLCAFDVGGCEHLDWVRPVSVQDAIGWLTSTASSASDHADGQPLLTRRARTGDSYTPTIVVVDAAIIEHDEVDRLVAAAGLTAIVVTINHPVGYDTGWTITCSPDSVRLDRYRFTVLRSTGVSEPAADHVAAYLAEAAGETVTDHDLVALLDPADPTSDPCPVSVDPTSLRSSAYGVHPDDLTTSDEPVDLVDTVAVAVEEIGADREDRDDDPQIGRAHV